MWPPPGSLKKIKISGKVLNCPRTDLSLVVSLAKCITRVFGDARELWDRRGLLRRLPRPRGRCWERLSRHGRDEGSPTGSDERCSMMRPPLSRGSRV